MSDLRKKIKRGDIVWDGFYKREVAWVCHDRGLIDLHEDISNHYDKTSLRSIKPIVKCYAILELLK